ncbi:hypothetical protein [Kitasatospora sp. NPDC090091]|uniref:hypothetical protein n=1 Tax=Kitasatospora sp. NPDC090091 TaxID=3364081 RepID=UPI003829E978
MNSAPTHDLLMICDTCGKDIADGQGDIWVKNSDLTDRRTALREWKERHATESDGGWYTPKQLLERPQLVRWRVTHNHGGCDDDIEAGAYSLEVHRCRTWPALVNWTAHLLGTKTWLKDTDWNKVLEGVSRPGGGTRIVAAPPASGTA